MGLIWLVLLLVLLVIQTLTILISQNRRPSKAVSWIFISTVIPVLGLLMYILMGKSYRSKPLRYKSKQWDATAWKTECPPLPIHDSRHADLLGSIQGSSITLDNEVKVLTNAENAYASMLSEISRARHHIHIEVYTIRDDSVGQRFQKALISKAQEGVEVRIIYDGLGSKFLSASYIRAFQDAGVQIHSFLPFWKSLIMQKINYRNHRKTIIIDGVVGFTGGINFGDEYLGKSSKFPFWRDTHLYMTGGAVSYLQRKFIECWKKVNGEWLQGSEWFPENNESEQGGQNEDSDLEATMKQLQGQQAVQMISDGPDTTMDAILEAHFSAAIIARDRLYIATPYFIPDESMNMALRRAAASGVDVRIILPKKPDSIIVYWASLSYIHDLLNWGVRFYLYQKGFMHAKIVLVDHTYAMVGSANMDKRSFFDNFEMTAVLFDPKPLAHLEADFQEDLSHCDEIDLAMFGQTSWLQNGKEIAARLLSSLF